MDTDLSDLVAANLEKRPAHTIFCCPECGSFLDAPRVDPQTGELRRKCVACDEWHLLAEPGSGN